MTLFFTVLEWLLWIFLVWMSLMMVVPYHKFNVSDDFIFLVISVVAGSIIMVKFDKTY